MKGFSEDPQKREAAKRRGFSFRLNVFFFSTFLLFCILIIRLAVLQFVEGPTYAAEKARLTTGDVRIPPIRGNIYDASGKEIAYSTSTMSLYYQIETGINAERGREYAEKLHDVFARYGDPDNLMEVEDIVKQMDLDYRLNNAYTPRRIKSDLTKEEIAYFSENRDQFPGIDIMEDSIRHYDTDTIAVQLVGYLKKYRGVKESVDRYKDLDRVEDPRDRYLDHEDVGMDGLEYMYQDELRGRNGLKTYPIDARGHIVGPMEMTKPEKGNDLHLTIHREVQSRTEDAIMSHLEKLRTSPRRQERAPYANTGLAVAMEVKTGKVVAMASMPDYDPNLWHGGGISTADFREIEYLYLNGAIRQVYQNYADPEERAKHPSSLVPLGSTMKPLTVLIGLNEQLFGPGATYNDRGVFYFGREGTHRTSIKNAGSRAYGMMDGARAIEKSSNTFMAEMIGNRLNARDGSKGVELWDDYMKQFGLGVVTGSGLPGESAGVVDYFHEAENASSQSALIRASFGQQGRYTALQLAQYTATMASRGQRLKPQFVEKITDSEGRVVQSFEPEVLNEIDIPDAYWNVIERGMSRVSSQGFEGVDYTYLRKTGTSEQQVAGKVIENAVFIAYAPAKDPVLAVAVIVPEGGSGGYGAAPIARQIFDAYDDYYGLSGEPKLKQQQQSQAEDEQGEEE
ncbi:peptidoglycan D,D-transpeptidase FtsI family protein [Paenibacillus sp. 1P07SE]|uniref:peptidoglycan D,D-transpeptidase FtsI family protein n=1 Tax=Paenibacillus sp. 1P07SE TaxID=3132209 RepID=UPI0039A63342